MLALFRPLGDTSGGGVQEVPLFFVKFPCVSLSVGCCAAWILGWHDTQQVMGSLFGFGTWVLRTMVRQLKQLVKEPDLVEKVCSCVCSRALKEARS